ncbi:hypothetical protein JCM11491_001955 [Sporobolomyces phaffii]
MPNPPTSSLSSIVSQLVRAQVGAASVPASTPDDDLDARVAAVLLAEAREASRGYAEHGTRAYYDRDKERTRDLRRPNTTFLSNVLRNVGDHNEHVRRQELDHVRRREQHERDEADRWRAQHSSTRTRTRHEPRSPSPPPPPRSSSSRSKDDTTRRRERERDSSDTRDTRSDRDRDRDRHRRRDRRDERRRPKRSPSPALEREREATSTSSKKKQRRYGFPLPLALLPPSETLLTTTTSNARRSRSPVVPPPPPPPPNPPPAVPCDPVPSKMDKYFSPTYDPLLDFTPAQLELASSGSGGDREHALIGEGTFDAWDRMLRTVQERKEDKKLREAREKDARRRERDKKRKDRRRRRGEAVSSSSSSSGGSGDEAATTTRTTTGDGLMGIKYAKKGATREWDRGKQSPT